jgi:hypothetical protein
MSTCAHCGIVRVHIALFFQCMKMRRVLKKKTNQKNSYCFEFSEIFALNEPHVVVVNKKLPFRSKNISKS